MRRGLLSTRSLVVGPLAVGAQLPWLFRDRFTDDRAAGSVNGTYSDDGKTIRSVPNDSESRISISSGRLNYSGLASPSFSDPRFGYAGVSAVAGRAFLITRPDNNYAGYWGFSAGASGAVTSLGVRDRSAHAVTYVLFDGAAIDVGLPSTRYLRYVALWTGVGGIVFVYLTSTQWMLAWVGYGSFSTQHPAIAPYSASGVADAMGVVDLRAPFNSNYGLATQQLSGARSAGDTFTHEANCIVEWVATTVANGQQMAIRRQDDNNLWRIDVAADGSIALQEVVAGTPTSRGTGGAGSIANGQRMVVIADGTTIRVYANNALKITYASASNFQTATGGKLLALGTGGAISDIVSWPRYLSGTALSIMNQAFSELGS